MRSSTAFKISFYGLLVLVIEIILFYISLQGNNGHFPLGWKGILLVSSLLFIYGTTAMVIASAISGVVGIIAKKKKIPLWLFIGIVIAVTLCIRYLIGYSLTH